VRRERIHAEERAAGATDRRRANRRRRRAAAGAGDHAAADRGIRPPAAAGTTRPAALGDLSDREIEVFELIGRGRSNHEMAAQLFISEATQHVFGSGSALRAISFQSLIVV
jgi:DNA-binding NarL/FixJ family response regulator